MSHAHEWEEADVNAAMNELQDTDAARTVRQHDLLGRWVDRPGMLQTASEALQFILAGNAYFTLKSTRTGARYTYRVNKPDDKGQDERWAGQDVRHFVGLLSGPDNDADYTYLGMITGGFFKLTRASKMREDSVPVQALKWTLKALYAGHMPTTLEVWHEGRCGRCGRRLTVPESIAAGIGPECIKHVGGRS